LAAVGVDRSDDAAGAVEDPDAGRVAQRDDVLADGDLTVADEDGAVAEVAGCVHERPGAAVQIGDVAAAHGDHHRLLASLAGARHQSATIRARTSTAVFSTTIRPRSS